jgi:hypothetical protein
MGCQSAGLFGGGQFAVREDQAVEIGAVIYHCLIPGGSKTQRDSPEGYFVVIRAYIDESYAEPRTFALGCAVAKGKDWTWIARDWKRCLERVNRRLKAEGRAPISRYHASKLNSQQGEFAGWSKAEECEFTRELISILGKHHIHIIGYTVDLRELSALLPEFKDPKSAACAVVARLLWVEVAEQARHLDRNPVVTVVYERGPFDGDILKAYNAMKNDEGSSEHVCLAGVSSGRTGANCLSRLLT